MSWKALHAKGRVDKAVRSFYGGKIPPKSLPEWPDLGSNWSRTEQSFIEVVQRKRKGPVLRAGWPDYVVWNRGLPMFVEVKAGIWDELRPSQRRTFALLESLGLDIYVWVPERPDSLTPWRRHGSQ